MPTTSPKMPRKLKEKINGKDVLMRELVNDDLDRVDELTDEWSELDRQVRELTTKVEEAEEPDERAELRKQARELKRRQREMDEEMLVLYIEDTDGNPFTGEVIKTVPVRVQTSLTRQAMARIYGDEQDPTSGTSAS